MRRNLVAFGAVVVLVLAGACGNAEESVAQKLRAAVRGTEATSRKFAYVDKVPGTVNQVQGLVEDDGRYKVSLSVNTRPTLDEVVADDTLVDRFQDPNAVDLFLRPASSPATATPASSSPSATQALRERRWVLDPAGAPELAATAGQKRVQGQDPLYDSLTALRYVAQSIEEQQFKVFNAHDLEYDPKEDHFPKPKEGGDVIRYDAVRPPLPKPAQTQGANGRQVLPALQHFRRMSIYVRKSVVVQVMEDVDVQSRVGELLKMNDLALPKNVPQNQVAESLIDIVNRLRKGQGDEPIRVRKMELRFSEIGAKISITLPTDVVNGNLSVLRDRGRITPVATG
jgi:hypothetical protein